MARELTEIEVKVVDGATKALNSIAASAKAGKTTFTELSSAIGLVENALGKIAGVANFAVDLLNPAREAETALNRVGVATNATAAELELLRTKSNQVAFDLRVPFDQVAAGAEQLAREGANATQVIANIAPVAAFAKTALITTKEAAGQLSDVLDTFGAGIEQIGAVGDAIIATAQGAGTSAQVLTEGLAKIGPAASQAGLSVNQTVAILGALAEKGIEGGRAAKQLETIFLELQNPASQAGAALKQLGLDGGNLGPVFQRLSTDSAAAEAVLSQLSDKPRLAMKSLLADGGGALTELTGIIEKSGGASAEAAGKLGSTFDGAVTRIGIALDALKASFFTPLLKPLADEIDAVSAKIQAFAGTKDFETLKAIVLDFTKTTIEQLNKIGSEFDSTAALAGIKQFVLDVRVQFAGLAEAAKTTKTILDGFGVALNGAQSVGAEIKAIVGDIGVGLGKLDQKIQGATDSNTAFIKTFEGLAESGRTAAQVQELEFAASIEALRGEVGPATIELRKMQEAQLAAADAARSGAQANKEAVTVLPQVTELSQGLKDALNQTADASVRVGNGIVEAVKKPVGPVDALRAKLAALQESLRKAFADDATKEAQQAIVDQIQATTQELNALTGASKTAAAAVASVGDKAAEAAPKIASVGDAARKTADDAKKLDSAASNAADSISKTGSSATAAAAELGEVSAEFARMAASINLLDNDQGRRLAGRLREEREAAARRQAQIRDEIAALDPLEQAVKRVSQQYKLIGQGQTRQLAEQELRLQQIRQQQSAGGAGAGGSGGGGNAQPTTQSGGININLALSALDPASLSNDTIKDLARRLADPLRTFILSGA